MDFDDSAKRKIERIVDTIRLCVSGNYTNKSDDPYLSQLAVSLGLARAWHMVDRLKILAISPLVPESNVLLIGSYGAGKTYLSSLMAEVYGIPIYRIQGAVGANTGDFAGVLDVRKAVKQEFGVVYPDYADNRLGPRLLFIDEINRLSPHEMNYLTSILAERKMDTDAKFEVDTQDRMIQLKNLTCIATRNRQDEATFSISAHLLDRFNVSLLIESNAKMSISAKGNYLKLKANKNLRVFEEGELQELVNRISSIPVSNETIFVLDAFVHEMSCESYGGEKEFISLNPCSKCQKGGGNCVCGYLSNDFIPSNRMKEHLVQFGKVEAFLRGDTKAVMPEHVEPFIFPTLAHRVMLNSDAFRLIREGNFRDYLPDDVSLASQISHFDIIYALGKVAWENAVSNVRRVVNTPEMKNVFSALSKFKTALVMETIMSRIDAEEEVIRALRDQKQESFVRLKEAIESVSFIRRSYYAERIFGECQIAKAAASEIAALIRSKGYDILQDKKEVMRNLSIEAARLYSEMSQTILSIGDCTPSRVVKSSRWR